MKKRTNTPPPPPVEEQSSGPVFTNEGQVDVSAPCAERIIKDRWGNDHHYTLYPTPAGHAFDRIGEILEIVGPIAQAVAAAFRSGEGISQALEGLSKYIIGKGGHKYVCKIMYRTARDGKYINDHLAFNRAYTLNLRECVTALVWTLSETYGDFFPGDLESTGSQWGQILHLLRTEAPKIALETLGVVAPESVH